MNTFWILIILSFNNDVMSAWKLPYTFSSEVACREHIVFLQEQTTDKVIFDCELVEE